MSYYSGFFNAVDQGEGNYDRVYSAADFAHYFSLFVGNGVFLKIATNLQVTAQSSPDLTVKVNPGSGWINGYYLTVPPEEAETLTVLMAEGSLSRIDSVIMGLNLTTRKIDLYVKEGIAEVSPSPSSLIRTNSLYELELAQISVRAGASQITQSDITDMRADSSRCGIVVGLIDQIDATNLFAQFTTAFNAWFEEMRDQLSEDAAGNLQLQIDQIDSTLGGFGNITDLDYEVLETEEISE